MDKKFPSFYGTQKFTRFPPLVPILGQINSVHTLSSLYLSPSNIILPSTAGFSQWLFPSGFPTRHPYAFLFTPIFATCSTILMLYFSTLLVMVSNANFSLYTGTNVLAVCVGPCLFLGSLFSNILSVFSSLDMQDQGSHTHKAGKSVFLYVLMVVFLDSERKKASF